MKIYCNTGDPRLDEMSEQIIRSCAEMLGEIPDDIRFVISCRLEDGKTGEPMILLEDGAPTHSCLSPNCRILKRPYSIKELENTVRILLAAVVGESEKESEPAAEKGQEILPLFDGRRVTFGDITASLTKREAAVFAVLYENKGSAVSREVLCERVWGGETNTNLCDVYVCRLRTALEPVFGKGFLVNIRTEGYMMI